MTIQNAKSYIGIDVSKAMLDVHILPSNKFMQFKNDPSGILKLVKKINAILPKIVVFESTGGYEAPLAKSLYKAGIPVAVINPRCIRDYARAIGKLAKTDRIDAEVIASYAQKLEPASNYRYDEHQALLIELNTRRQQLNEMITMEKNRLDKVTRTIRKSVNNILKVLQKELEAINLTLKDLIENNAEYTKKSKILTSIKGVGDITAAGILAALPEIGTIEPKKISALAGLAPFNCDSGNMRGKRKISGGRTMARQALYMATVVATRHNPHIKDFYQRLCLAGKKKIVALVACMHKLLIIMNALVRKQQLWNVETAS